MILCAAEPERDISRSASVARFISISCMRSKKGSLKLTGMLTPVFRAGATESHFFDNLLMLLSYFYRARPGPVDRESHATIKPNAFPSRLGATAGTADALML